MAFELAKTRPLVVVVDDDAITLRYRSRAFNLEVYERVMDLKDDEEAARRELAVLLAELVTEWDVELNGVPVATDVAGMRLVPLGGLFAILDAIKEEANRPKATPALSGVG